MHRKILIVDDDEEMCQEMASILRDEGYLIETAFDGQDGRNLLEKNPFDLLLLDLKMPKITGFQLLQFIRESGIKTKVVVVTGSLSVSRYVKQEISDPGHPKQHLLKLADKVVNKPFEIDDVLNEIKNLIGGPEVEKNHKKEETATGAKEKVRYTEIK